MCPLYVLFLSTSFILNTNFFLTHDLSKRSSFVSKQNNARIFNVRNLSMTRKIEVPGRDGVKPLYTLHTEMWEELYFVLG